MKNSVNVEPGRQCLLRIVPSMHQQFTGSAEPQDSTLRLRMHVDNLALLVAGAKKSARVQQVSDATGFPVPA
jgi:hypothetical protein